MSRCGRDRQRAGRRAARIAAFARYARLARALPPGARRDGGALSPAWRGEGALHPGGREDLGVIDAAEKALTPDVLAALAGESSQSAAAPRSAAG